MLDVAGGDELADEFPQAGGTETDFGERACGGSDHGAPGGRDAGQKSMGAGKRDQVGDVFNFTALHPAIFFQVILRRIFRQQVLDGGKGSATVRERDDADGVHVVARGPAGPDAGDGCGGIDENAVHVDE